MNTYPVRANSVHVLVIVFKMVTSGSVDLYSGNCADMYIKYARSSIWLAPETDNELKNIISFKSSNRMYNLQIV